MGGDGGEAPLGVGRAGGRAGRGGGGGGQVGGRAGVRRVGGVGLVYI